MKGRMKRITEQVRRKDCAGKPCRKAKRTDKETGVGWEEGQTLKLRART
jgi:hypothetical protein